MVEESKILLVAPTHTKGRQYSRLNALLTIPFQQINHLFLFQYKYANDDFVPAPSACMN